MDFPQKQFLSVALLSALIATGCGTSTTPAEPAASTAPAAPKYRGIAPIDDTADGISPEAYEHDQGSERSTWRSRTRFIPIETLISDNLQELQENAEAVFVGVLTESALENDQEGSLPITRYDFVVENFIKGEGADNGTVSLRNFGGRNLDTGETVSTQFSFDFVVGERYLIFLRPDFAKSTLPIIFALSVHEGGDVLANQHGQQLVQLDERGAMSFSTAASHSPLNYGFVQQDAAASVPARLEAPAPVPESGDVEIVVKDERLSVANVSRTGLSKSVSLDSVVDQILD